MFLDYIRCVERRICSVGRKIGLTRCSSCFPRLNVSSSHLYLWVRAYVVQGSTDSRRKRKIGGEEQDNFSDQEQQQRQFLKMAEFWGKNSLLVIFSLTVISAMILNLLLSCLIVYQIQVNQLPDHPLHNCRDSRSGGRRIICTSEVANFEAPKM